MKSSMPTLPLKSQNKSFIKERILRNQKNFPTVNSEKSITTNESYTLLIDKNNKKQSSFNINSIISPRYVTIVNNINSGYFKKRTLDRSITKLPKIPKIKIISDADYLIKERKKREGYMPTHIPVNIALKKSTEMNMNNYIIRKIKEKREEIMHNERKITEQFKIRQQEYDKQYKTFLNTVEENHKKKKEEENQLNSLKLEMNEKIKIIDEIKAETKNLEDQLKRIITSILTYKKYGSFVHKIFEQKFIYDKLEEFDGKSYYKTMQKLIEIYENNQKEFNLSENEDEFLDNLLFQGEEQFFSQYINIEENLRRILGTRNDAFKEMTYLNIKNKNEINNLKTKKEGKERDKEIYDESQILQARMVNSIKEYDIEETKKYLLYIIELGECMCKNKNKVTNIDSIGENLFYCNDTIKLLEEKEYFINKYMNEIENVFKNGNDEDIMLIENIINERKKFNKRQKQIEIKKIQEEIRIKKNLNTINTNRIVIKGRKVIQDFPLIKNQKKKKKIVVKKDNEDLDYLYYSSDDN